MRANRRGDIHSQIADAAAAKKMPVPVADSQTKSNFASSAFGAGTTGAVRTIALSRPGTGYCGVTRFNSFFTCGSPQAKTKSVRSTQGIHADTRSRNPGCATDGDFSNADSSGNRHVSFGRQYRSNTARETSETTPATTSTSHGPWKF